MLSIESQWTHDRIQLYKLQSTGEHQAGFRFAPRIRRFGHLRLYPIKSKSTYSTLKPIMGRRINTDLIYEN